MNQQSKDTTIGCLAIAAVFVAAIGYAGWQQRRAETLADTVRRQNAELQELRQYVADMQDRLDHEFAEADRAATMPFQPPTAASSAHTPAARQRKRGKVIQR